jgi:hypothetical protein
MASWTNENNDEKSAVAKYMPRNITNTNEFSEELRRIENNQSVGFVDKYKFKKQLMRTYFMAKQKEIDGYLDTFENYLLAKKDVEVKSITLEAQKSIMALEKEQLEVMKKMGLSHTDEISNTLIKSGNMLTEKLEEVEKSDMRDDIKKMTIDNIRSVWNKANQRILDNVDTYMDELYEKERKQKGF